MNEMAASEKCILIVSGHANQGSDLQIALRQTYYCIHLDPEKLIQGGFLAIDGIVIDIDLANLQAVERVRKGLLGVDRSKTFLVIVVDALRTSDIQDAKTLNPDDIILYHRNHGEMRPVNGAEFRALTRPLVDFTTVGLSKIHRLLRRFSGSHQPAPTIAMAFESGSRAMGAIFDMAHGGVAPSAENMQEDSREIIGSLAEHGLERWIDRVRQHHSATYQHCLIVTGVAAAFARSLGFSEGDVERITLGGMLHDIGKAMIPLEILEKPGPLTPEEWAVMRTHSTIGRDILERAGGFDPEMSDVIAHHHEYLDGSGYPEGLSGNQISDIVRIMTISDIFGALIEHRTYKAAMSSEQAFSILSSMTTKLDMPLVREFRRTALSIPTSN